MNVEPLAERIGDISLKMEGKTFSIAEWALSSVRDPELCHKKVLFDAEDPSRFLSPFDALEIVSRFANNTMDGFEPGTTVCMHMPNDVLYPVIYLAIVASGARWTGSNPAYTETELAHHLHLSQTKQVITDKDHVDIVRAAIKLAGNQAKLIVFSDILSERYVQPRNYAKYGQYAELISTRNSYHHPGHRGHRTLHDLLGPKMPVPSLPNKKFNVLATAVLMPTSGTTGLPKMAARTHQALKLESIAVEDNNSEKPYPIRRLFTTPIFHAFSTPHMIWNALKYGHETYIMKRFDGTYPDMIKKYGITETAAPPPMMHKFLDYDAENKAKLQSLKMIWSGGAALPDELRRQTLAIFNEPPRIVQVWGMTEGGWFTTFKFPEDNTDGSVGRLIDGVELKIFDETTDSDSGITTGELRVKSRQLMTEYWGDKDATWEARTSTAWFATGDIGYTKDGKVYLVDRKKDLIKVNAFQVAPAELEAVLLTSPLVKDVAVVGAGTDLDEHPLAFVVPAFAVVAVAVASTAAAAVKQHLRDRVAGYKARRLEVMFVSDIPKSGAGKVLKGELRKLVV